MPDTPRAIRIPDELWAAALAEAKKREESLSGAVRRFLMAYTGREH